MIDRARVLAFLTRPDRWKLNLAAAAALVLIAGVAIAPRAPAPVVRPSEEASAPLLRQEMRQRDLRDVFRQVQQVGAGVANGVVTIIGPAAMPARVHPDSALVARPRRVVLGYGLVASDAGDILTDRAAIGRGTSLVVEHASGTRPATVVGIDPETGAVLLHAEGLVGSAPVRVPSAPAPDTLAAIVSGDDESRLVRSRPGFIAGAGDDLVAFTTVGDLPLPGTPIFDLDGHAFALATDDDGMGRLVTPSLERLDALRARGTPLPRSLGLWLQDVTTEMRPFVGDAAVIVVGVDGNGPAGRAGVLVGDGLRALAGEAVTSVGGAIELVSRFPIDAPADVVLVRGGRDTTVSLSAEETLDVAGPLPVATGDGIPILQLFAADALAPGVPTDADVISIDLKQFSERAAVNYLRRTRGPRLLYLRHGAQAFFSVAERRP